MTQLDDPGPVAGEDTVTCSDCGQEWSGPMRQARLARHRKAHHGSEKSTEPMARKPDRAPKPRKAPAGSTSLPKLRKELEATYTFLGFMWSRRDPICGVALSNAAPDLAAAWVAWAESSPRVRETLERFLVASGGLTVVAAHAPLVMTIVEHHGPRGRAMAPEFDPADVIAAMPPEVRAIFDQLPEEEQGPFLAQAAAMMASVGANGSAPD